MGSLFWISHVLPVVANRTFGKCETTLLPIFCTEHGVPDAEACVPAFVPRAAVLAQVLDVTALGAST
jgi:hypothetical protein